MPDASEIQEPSLPTASIDSTALLRAGTDSLPDDIPGLPQELWEELIDFGDGSAHGSWGPIDRVRAVVARLTYGSSVKAGEMTGIPHRTIRDWGKQAWWPKVLYHVHKMYNDEIIADLTQTVVQASKQLKDRVVNGNLVYNSEGDPVLDQDGNHKRRKLNAHELAIDGIAIPFERRAMLLGNASIGNRDNQASTLRELKELFREIGIGQKKAEGVEIVQRD